MLGSRRGASVTPLHGRTRIGDPSAPPCFARSSDAWRSTKCRRTHQETGEGIGLSIVKRLCDLLNGSVELESTIETGTTFRILFPKRYGE
jgi:signal transduction histidine kinase